MLAYPDVQALDLTGPHEVFAAANHLANYCGMGRLRYELCIVGPQSTVTTESGLRFAVDPLPDPGPPGARADTLLIPGGDGARELPAGDPVIEWVRHVGADAGRLACVCTGAFIAAAAGLLDGRHVTTHWAWASSLAELHPDVDVDLDAIYRFDPGDSDDRSQAVWTSAGVTAGIDLALAMVEADLGVEVAQEVARWLVVFMRRGGGQSQFAPAVWTPRAGNGPIRAAQELIEADPAAIGSVAELAAAVGLSTRHLSRRFTSELGESPARYLERVRLTAARQQLEATDDGVALVARRCGFGTGETLRRVFQRHLGVSPDTYRRRFGRPTHAPAVNPSPT